MQTANEKMEIFRAWADSFLQAPVEPMSKSTSGVFITLTLMENKKEPIPEQLHSVFQFQLFRKRGVWIGLRATDHACAFIASLCSSPGELVMYCYALKHWQTLNSKDITIATIADIFPMGFPMNDALEDLWDQQKIGGANMLDSISASDFNEAGQDQGPLSAA